MILLDEKNYIKEILKYRQRLNRLLSIDLIHKAYRHNEDIATEKLNDNSKREIIAARQQQGRQLSQHQGVQHSLQHGPHLRVQQGRHQELQHRAQHRPQQGEHFEQHHGSQLRPHYNEQQDRQQDLQHERQQRLHQDQHFEPHHELQHAQQIIRQFECIYINEVIYLPLA